MEAPEKRRLTALWIRSLVGGRTLKDAAADISAVTEWPIDHSRLSRYANPKGTAHIGPDVVGHFEDYARKRGLPALDLTPPEPELSYEERHLLLLAEANKQAKRQADALEVIAERFKPAEQPSDLIAWLGPILEAAADQAARLRIPLQADPTPRPG